MAKKMLSTDAVNCFSCLHATRILTNGGEVYECGAILGKGEKNEPLCHQAHQIMVYRNMFYIPEFCPSTKAVKAGTLYPPKTGNQCGKVKTYRLVEREGA